MASCQFLCNYYLPPSFNGRNPSNLCRNSSLSAFWGHEYCNFNQKLQFRTTHFVRAMGSDSQTGRKQVEITFDPDERINRFADEVDKNTGLSRLTLFSPCKINVFLRITKKREDGFHDLASLFHVFDIQLLTNTYHLLSLGPDVLTNT